LQMFVYFPLISKRNSAEFFSELIFKSIGKNILKLNAFLK